MRSSGVAAVAAAAVLLAACPGVPTHRQPVGPDDGLQLSGRIGGRQINVSDGEPEVTLGDCDRDPSGGDALCIESFTIDGDPLTLVVENPELLAEGVTFEVVAQCFGDGCADVALVDVLHGGARLSARGGELVVGQAGPRYAARVDLLLSGGGSLNGRFNVLPAGP